MREVPATRKPGRPRASDTHPLLADIRARTASVRRAEELLRDAYAWREDAIVEALDAGLAVVAIARAADVSHQRIGKVRDRRSKALT